MTRRILPKDFEDFDDSNDYDDYDEQYQIIEKIHEFDRNLRSRIIYQVIEIESNIEQIIAWHFCREESQHILFISLMFMDGQITFSQKITILKKLLRDSYPDIYKDVSSIFSQLGKIRELRNKFAHSKMTFPKHLWVSILK